MTQLILDALYKLDPTNDGHWTMNGDAKLETVKFFANGTTVTREELEKIAPGYNRDAMRAYVANLKTGAQNAATEVSKSTGDGETNNVTEQIEMEDRPANGEINIETLAEEIASTNEAILKTKRIQDEAGRELIRLQAIADQLADRMVVVNPGPTHQQNIKAYLAQVRSTNQRRAAARQELANSGIDIDGLQAVAAPAPIDRTLKGRRR